MILAVSCCALAGPAADTGDRDVDRFLGEEGEQLYYAVEGDGCPVVLMGGLMDSRQWDDTSRALGDDVMSIRFDPRGTGRSDLAKNPFTEADDLAALLDALGFERAVIVGHSASGAIALEFALAYPDRAQGVVAVAPFIDGWRFSDEMQERIDRLAVAFASGAQQFIEEIFFDDYYIPAPLDPSVRGRARMLIEEGYDKATSGDTSLLRTPKGPLIDRVDEVAVPVLLAIGKLDHPDVHRRVEHLDEVIPDSDLFVVKSSGHMSPLEAPDMLARGIREFLGSLKWDSREACREAATGGQEP
jgi:pimeloyl-ACP methyl ester carboxylesterase